VVELRIFEGEGAEKTDVTFGYNANFFLFATLELARPIAHGRMQPQPAQLPVLTGMPVSGMAYLDRPTEAGYFIFPDLSVRHEGKYKLSFNLYEETKEAKDADAEPRNDQHRPKLPGGANAPESSFDWRLEVKSAVFTVFSAKKFPGLAESTVLSRTVAEQGCRVRIRRDVRMRRRDGKANGDYEEAVEEEYVRTGRTPSVQDPYRERSRSLSNESAERQAYPEIERRMSGDYSSQQYHPSAQSGPQSYLSFGGSSGNQYQAPPPQFAQPAPPAPPSYQSAPPPAPYHHSGPQFRQPAPPPSHGQYAFDRPPYAQSAYPPATPPREREYEEADFRRTSASSYATAPATSTSPYPAVDSNYNRNPYQPYPQRTHSPPMQSPVNLAPLKMPLMEPKYEGQTSPAGPLSSVSRIAPPLPSPGYDRSQERPGSYGQYPNSLPPPLEVARNGKRSFETVFPGSTASQNQPLFNGMRPGSAHPSNSLFDDDDDTISFDQLKMQYKRADGSSYSRELPILE
jgi:hypothetical protein